MRPIAFEKKISDITPDFCRQHSIYTLLLDVDNTLALHGNATPYPGVPEWTEEMRKNGIVCIIISNNSDQRVSPFAAKLGLPFISNAAKPLPFGIKRALAMAGAPCKKTALIGDQIFTDLLGAKLAGIKMILLEPIEDEKSGFLHVKRKIDRFFRKILYRR